ncbi:nuclear transport factor 2 family protein [Novosphingobium bradum]|uniref:Nuclear transport factor 2 family protein n=1 Tax=Novosphingobium bradum TaxID=1737444 RepID=A0ABV7IIX6_9SPHN
MDPVQTLLAIEAIRNLKARYFYCLDTKDWDGFTQVWAPQMAHEMIAEQQKIAGPREDFVAYVAKALAGVVTVHHGHNPQIEITSPTTARAIWPFVDRLKPGPQAHPGAPELIGYGHYHETYEKSEEAGWQIKTQLVTRLRLDRPGAPGFDHAV